MGILFIDSSQRYKKAPTSLPTLARQNMRDRTSQDGEL